MSVLCRLGLHDWRRIGRHISEIRAPAVPIFWECTRCGVAQQPGCSIMSNYEPLTRDEVRSEVISIDHLLTWPYKDYNYDGIKTKKDFEKWRRDLWKVRRWLMTRVENWRPPKPFGR